MKNFQLMRVGTRVRVLSIGVKGRITYLDQKTLFAHHLNPVQIELDEPFGDHTVQQMYRTSLKDLKLIKKGRKKR